MVTGTCPGAGASTLAVEIADRLRRSGQLVFELDENAVWGERQLGEAPVDHSTAWPEFRGLLHEREQPPSSQELLEAFGRIRTRVSPDAVWIQDWSWLDLAAVMPWAQHDNGALEEFAQSLRAQAAVCGPVLLHSVVDPLVGLQRAIADRGMVWFERHCGPRVSGVSREGRLQALARTYRDHELRRWQLLVESGWERFDLDGEESLSVVAMRALEVIDGVSARTG